MKNVYMQNLGAYKSVSDMDNFKAVYKILTALEKAMDSADFDMSQISAERLGVSDERWARYIEMMQDVGYIKGAQICRYNDGSLMIDSSDIRITLKGLEYLQENSIMQRIYMTAKGFKEVVPRI